MSDISNVFYLHLGQITPRRAKLGRVELNLATANF
jgi:hypothetical protein